MGLSWGRMAGLGGGLPHRAASPIQSRAGGIGSCFLLPGFLVEEVSVPGESQGESVPALQCLGCDQGDAGALWSP